MAAPPCTGPAPTSGRYAKAARIATPIHVVATGWARANPTVRAPIEGSSSSSCSSTGRSSSAAASADSTAPRAASSHLLTRNVSGAMYRLRARSGIRLTDWARTRRLTVPGRCSRFHPQAANSCQTSSNRRARDQATSFPAPCTRYSGNTHRSESQLKFFSIAARVARSVRYRDPRWARPGRSPRMVAARWRTTAAGSVTTRNPASRTRQQKSRSSWEEASRSSGGPARCSAGLDTNMAQDETNSTSRVRSY